MIEKIYCENYQLNLNQGDPPDPGEHQANNQNNIIQNPLDNNPFFNILFSDQSSEDPQQKEEKEEDKNQDAKRNTIQKSDESELVEENEQQNIFPEKGLNINNTQFQNDIEEIIEDNVDNEPYSNRFENLTSFIDINPNIKLNLIHDINISDNIDKNFSKYKNSNIKITRNENYLINENLIEGRGPVGTIIRKKRSRERDKVKCRKKIVKKYYIKHFIRFLKKYGNSLIKKSKLQKKLYNNKLYSPTKSFVLFLINENNSNLLLFTVKDIFCYKNKKLKKNSQINNEKCINNLLDYINEFYDENKENYEKIISFLNMNIQDASVLFEESKEFKDYSTNEKVIKHNRAFKQKYGFCLIEKNEFIKMIKSDGNSDDKK